MAILIDHLIRFSAFGILIVAAFLVFRRGGGSMQAKLVSAASLTGAAYLLCSSATVRDAAGQLIIVIQVACLAAPWAFWAASIALFKDGFRLMAVHWAALLLVEMTGLIAIYGPTESQVNLGVHNLLVLSFFIHATIVAWRGRGNDLLEVRRRFRLIYVASVALIGVTISVAELFIAQTPAPPALETAAAAGILIVSALLAVYALDIDPDKIFLPKAQGVIDGTLREVDHSAEQRVLDQIAKAMEENRLYREAGLTIGGLAAELRIPEHRLRAAINRGLGYRNFNAFVNAYRIEAVKKALRDPDQIRSPVLTLALEAGFNSIAPFNRAFRKSTGMTPTEYRVNTRLGED